MKWTVRAPLVGIVTLVVVAVFGCSPPPSPADVVDGGGAPPTRLAELSADFEATVIEYMEYTQRPAPASPSEWVAGYRTQLDKVTVMQETFTAWDNRVSELQAAGKLVYPDGVDASAVAEYRSAAAAFVSDQVEVSSFVLDCFERASGDPARAQPCVSNDPRQAAWLASFQQFQALILTNASGGS